MESIIELPSLVAIDPVKPPAGYIGGKRALSKRLIALIDAIPHASYIEPFVGMGGVFFRRTRRPKAEVINDISGDVATLFRILQRHYQPFMEMLKWRFASRAEYDRLIAVDPATCTDLERAARFLFLQRNGFGGKVTGRHFGISYAQPSRFRLSTLEPLLQDVHDRLEGVWIEQLPFDKLIRRYDRPGALFYIDPPYWDCEDDYGSGVFSKPDFERLGGLLEGLQGRFILSINDRPEIRAIFAKFVIEEVELSYRLSGKETPARELIISTALK